MKALGIAAVALALCVVATGARAQGGPPAGGPMGQAGTMPMHQGAGTMPMRHGGMMPMGGGTRMHAAAGCMGAGMRMGIGGGYGRQAVRMPTAPGQAAFGAAQEIVRMLLADPMTNWSKVDIDALRQHLIDMNEVVMRAGVRKQPLADGLLIDVTGSGRTLEAIRRMIPAHAQDINGLFGWTVTAQEIAGGEALRVTSANPADVQKIRGLGFLGILTLGTHQLHHLEMAKGEMMHMH